MGRQSIAQAVRQIVDERRVAKMVLAAPVVAMCLERIPAIWHEDGRSSARFEHPHDLFGGRAIILDMLKHLVAQHEIKVVVRIGQVFAGGQLERRFRHILYRDLQMFAFDVDAANLSAIRLQRLHIHAHTATIYQHAIKGRTLCRQRPVQNHVQPAILARPPYKAGIAAQCSAFTMQIQFTGKMSGYDWSSPFNLLSRQRS